MPRSDLAELSATQIKTLMTKALAIVDQELSPQDHLPPKVFAFLQPLVDTTCQGYFSTAMMALGTMAALTNGASARLWSQRPTPLVACVFQVGYAQQGKSRLFAVCEEMLDTCDGVITEEVQRMIEHGDAAGASPDDEKPVNVKSINLQSFTFTEFFYRCASEYPLLVFEEGDPRAKKARGSAVWFGRACNLDEAYEFFDGLGMLSSARSDKDRSPSTNASTLNTLISSGKTRRATRTSANFGAARGKPVSVSVLGNVHPDMFISMDRGLIGKHTACTKERFVICVDHAVARHAALPEASKVREGGSPWSWLPLTPQQAQSFGWDRFFNSPEAASEAGLKRDSSDVTGEGDVFEGPAGGYVVELPDGVESRLRYRRAASDQSGRSVHTEFRISARWNLDDPTEHIHTAAKRVVELFSKKPHADIEFEDDARKILLGNQVALRLVVPARALDIVADLSCCGGLKPLCRGSTPTVPRRARPSSNTFVVAFCSRLPARCSSRAARATRARAASRG